MAVRKDALTLYLVLSNLSRDGAPVDRDSALRVLSDFLDAAERKGRANGR